MSEHRPLTEYCQVMTTTDSQEAAEELARSIVEARLAACVQVTGPVRSVYRWRGTVETQQEWQVLAKTVRDRYDAVERHIRQRHGYDVPEIICVPLVTGSRDYLEWIATETS